MRIPRDLVAANAVALLVLVVVLIVGWREAAVFGLAVLLILDLLVVLRGRQPRVDDILEDSEDQPEEHSGRTL